MNEPIFRLNSHAIKSGDMSMNLSSGVIDISEVRQVAVHEIYTGSPSGSLLIQGSNDGLNFSTVDTNTVSTSGQKLVNLPNLGYKYLQVSWSAGGTGSLDIYISGKI